MLGCYECAQLTSNDCGNHGPTTWPQMIVPPSERDIIIAFAARVNARAEADILAGHPVTGAYQRAMLKELELL